LATVKIGNSIIQANKRTNGSIGKATPDVFKLLFHFLTPFWAVYKETGYFGAGKQS
jgi:hypothetical protein